MTEFANQVNQYVCENCGFVITTKNRINGTTPFTVGCKNDDFDGDRLTFEDSPVISKTGCGAMMESQFYKVDQNLDPTHYFDSSFFNILSDGHLHCPACIRHK